MRETGDARPALLASLAAVAHSFFLSLFSRRLTLLLVEFVSRREKRGREGARGRMREVGFSLFAHFIRPATATTVEVMRSHVEE